MSEMITLRRPPMTAATAAVIGMAAALAVDPAAWPQRAAPPVQTQQTANTHSAFLRSLRFHREGEQAAEFSRRIASVYADLLSAQQPLGVEFENVLLKNMDQLYES